MNLLLVDDDVVSRMALLDLAQALQVHHGLPPLTLVEAEDGEAAWTLLEEGLAPVLVLCDVQMPKLSGLDLLKRARAERSFVEQPFVLVTSAADVSTVRQSLSLGVSYYVVKPFATEAARASLDVPFLAILDKAMERPRATQARLKFTGERLQGYLQAFLTQIAQAQAEQEAWRVSEDCKSRLDALATGCLTLGLWWGAKLAKRLQEEGRRLGAERLRASLSSLQGIVEWQLEVVRLAAR